MARLRRFSWWYRLVAGSVIGILACIQIFGLLGISAPGMRLGASTSNAFLNNYQDSTTTALTEFVLVIKTGATESARKLPAHFNTTLERWPHVLLLSDFAEQINGHEVYDALEIVSSSIRDESDSFRLWRMLREHGKHELLESQQEPETGEQIQWLNNNVSSPRQEAWRLARFMNLPMAVKAYRYKSDAKWYAFIDADTYVSATNICRMFGHLDYTGSHYFGSQTPMGPGEFFGHGGSGYVLSQGALRRVVDLYLSQQHIWDLVADEGDFGEVPLARALLTLDIHLGGIYPHFQEGNPYAMPFDAARYGRALWCYPAVTYHHVSGEELGSLFQFEASWAAAHDRLFRHGDVFETLIAPQIARNAGNDWDNASADLVLSIGDEKSCGDACKSNVTCVQYSFGGEQCKHDGSLKLGRFREGWSSAWDKERLQHFIMRLDRKCEVGVMV